MRYPCGEVDDAPRYHWRAYMLDESRHFQGMDMVKRLLDEMARLKMNVFHWHLVDDPGWRIEIHKYPLLTAVGSKRDFSHRDITPEEWIQKQTLAMLSELAELIAEVNFKWWKNPRPVNPDNVREELVDILHFFVGMCNRSGMGSEELFSRYIKKNEENFKRQYGKSAKHGYELDGCADAPAGGSDGGAE